MVYPSDSQKITEETLTTGLRVHGVLLWIQPRDGDTVLSPGALVSDGFHCVWVLFSKVKIFPNKVKCIKHLFWCSHLQNYPFGQSQNEVWWCYLCVLFISPTECKKSVKGTEFRGTSFTKSVSGTTCQHWALDTPHGSLLNEPPYNMDELVLQGTVPGQLWQ